MKPDKLKLILFSLSAFIFWSCSSEPADFGEQYKKTLYIVNSRDMLYVGEHAYGSENNSMSFSVYCASSEPIKSDLTVQLAINPNALDSLNKKSALGNPLYIDKKIVTGSKLHIDGFIGNHSGKRSIRSTSYTPKATRA